MKYKGVTRDTDRHGNVRYYFRRRGMANKIRLREEYGSDAFEEELSCARLGLQYEKKDGPGRLVSAKLKRGSFGWLVQEYLRRADMADSTRNQKRRVLMRIGEETCLSQSGSELRLMAYSGLKRAHISTLRDQKKETPEAANHRVKALSALFEWAIDVGLTADNPAADVKRNRSNPIGHHTLTDEEIQQFLDHHPTGSKAHLAFTIFRYTGLRISDVAVFGRQHLYWQRVTDEETGETEKLLYFRITTTKQSPNGGEVVVDMPVLPPLAEALASRDDNQLTFLLSDWGRPFTIKGLGNRMRKWFDEAGLKHCSSHGIRKADAVIAAENGATAHQLLAMFGWTNIRQAEHYTRLAQRRKLASQGSKHLL